MAPIWDLRCDAIVGGCQRKRICIAGVARRSWLRWCLVKLLGGCVPATLPKTCYITGRRAAYRGTDQNLSYFPRPVGTGQSESTKRTTARIISLFQSWVVKLKIVGAHVITVKLEAMPLHRENRNRKGDGISMVLNNFWCTAMPRPLKKWRRDSLPGCTRAKILGIHALDTSGGAADGVSFPATRAFLNNFSCPLISLKNTRPSSTSSNCSSLKDESRSLWGQSDKHGHRHGWSFPIRKSRPIFY